MSPDELLRDPRLQRVVAAAEWPLAPERYAAHVSRFSSGPSQSGPLDNLRLDHLWLACSAAAGEARAVTRIVERHFARAAAAVRAIDPATADEALQRVRTKLFVAGKIAD